MLTSRYSAFIWLAIYLALQIGARFLSPPIHSPQAFLALILLSVALFTFLILGVLASLTAAVRDWRPACVMLAVGLVGWIVPLLVAAPPGPGGRGIRLALSVTGELCIILAAAGLGILLASAIRDRNILLPAAVFAAFADFFVVNYAGGVHWALNSGAKGQAVINAMSAHVPALHRGLPVLTVGYADYLFLAIFFACVHRFQLRLVPTFVAFFILLTFSLCFVRLTGAAIPGLAPMALGFVLANFRCFKLSREELQAMAAAAAIVLVAALFLILRRPHPSPPAPVKASVKRGSRPREFNAGAQRPVRGVNWYV